MAESISPSGMMMSGGNDLFGGGGLIGGLILGSLLRNNGNLFGGEGGTTAGFRSPPEQAQANMSLMQAIGAVDKSVALGTATVETSNAVQTGQLTNAINQATSAQLIATQSVKDGISSLGGLLSTQLNGVQQQVMENRYELSKDISTDGEKTRALLVQQYEATLNRQLSDANAAVIALQTKLDTGAATRGVEVTTTNNINQMQQQAQQQQQYAQLAHLIYGLSQNITNGAINVGSGTLTANPTNTNTNIR